MEPDPEWSHTDSAGHVHRHTPGRFTPDTLVRIGMWVEIDDEPGEFEWIPGGEQGRAPRPEVVNESAVNLQHDAFTVWSALRCSAKAGRLATRVGASSVACPRSPGRGCVPDIRSK